MKVFPKKVKVYARDQFNSKCTCLVALRGHGLEDCEDRETSQMLVALSKKPLFSSAGGNIISMFTVHLVFQANPAWLYLAVRYKIEMELRAVLSSLSLPRIV